MQKRHVVPWLCVSLWALSACAQVGQFAALDLKSAAQLASRGADPQGAACWTALTPVAEAIETAPTPGLASIIEADRLLASATQGPNAPCNAVGGLIISMVLRKAVPYLP
jgi:hypothetical protein